MVVEFEHTIELPVIEPGVAGGPNFAINVKIEAELVPQSLLAVTLISPGVEVLIRTLIVEVPLPLVIVLPSGTLQV